MHYSFCEIIKSSRRVGTKTVPVIREETRYTATSPAEVQEALRACQARFGECGFSVFIDSLTRVTDLSALPS